MTIQRRPSGWPEPDERGESHGQVSVADWETLDMRCAFIRFVPRQDGNPPERTFTVEASVDVDADGNLTGITVAWAQ